MQHGIQESDASGCRVIGGRIHSRAVDTREHTLQLEP